MEISRVAACGLSSAPRYIELCGVPKNWAHVVFQDYAQEAVVLSGASEAFSKWRVTQAMMNRSHP
jgi:hypothetical protein